MAIYFVDSSTLVKRYVSEAGSAWVLGLFNPAINNEIFVAAITRRARNESISASDGIGLQWHCIGLQLNVERLQLNGIGCVAL